MTGMDSQTESVPSTQEDYLTIMLPYPIKLEHLEKGWNFSVLRGLPYQKFIGFDPLVYCLLKTWLLFYIFLSFSFSLLSLFLGILEGFVAIIYEALFIPTIAYQVLDQIDDHITSSEHFQFSWFPHTEHVIMSRIDRTKEPVRDYFSWFWMVFVAHHCYQFAYWLR